MTQPSPRHDGFVMVRFDEISSEVILNRTAFKTARASVVLLVSMRCDTARAEADTVSDVSGR